MQEKFEIGQWLELTEGIGQVLYVRENYVEKYTEEYFEGCKVGDYIGDVLVCKLLCDFEGKIRKKNRTVAVRGQHCKSIDMKSKNLIKLVKTNSIDEYRKYLISDDKSDIGGSLTIDFAVPLDSLPSVKEEISSINHNLPGSFTLKEFLDISNEKGLSLNFDLAKKYVPGTGLNFSVILFNRLYKTVNKQRIYTRVWCRIR